MADEMTPDADTAVAELPPENATEKLEQSVEINDAGPCRKHIKVTVARKAIDQRFNEKFTELVRAEQSPINGFRPGKAPRKVIERRFRSSVEEQVRNEVLMASLEQLATDHKISPLSPPDLDPSKLEIPNDDSPFVYEFDVEVRPEFDLPDYKGIKLRRPTKTFTADDIAKEQRRLLEPAGELIIKPGDSPEVAIDDYIEADVVINDGEKDLNTVNDARMKVEDTLALTDGLAENFGKELAGAKVGDERSVMIKLAENAVEAHKGKTITAKFKVKSIKVMKLPELTPELLREFGVRNEDQFQELIAAMMARRLEYAQRQSFRRQILEQLVDTAKWELPNDLLIRQARQTLSRRVMEMRSAGMADPEIMGRMQVIQQNSIGSTAVALREHFVLQKIAELEKIEIEESDIDEEIDRIADRTGENRRKVRARMEKEEMIEALATEILERRALDVVLDNAVYEDVELKSEDEENGISTVSAEAAPATSDETTPA